MNIMMLLEMANEGYPDRTAFYDPVNNQSITYGGLFETARDKAAVLKDSGTSRCALLDVSTLCTPIALFSSAWAGIPYVPLNYRLTVDEIDALLERILPAYLITDNERTPGFAGRPELLTVDREQYAQSQSDTEVDAWSMEPEEVAVLLFTSGTTGTPKAAVMRHRHLVSYILSSVEYMSAEEHESTLVSVPPYHIAGIGAILSAVYSGRRVIQMAQFDAAEWLKLAREEHVTNTFVVPTMLARIVDELKGQDTANLPELESLAYGGGKMPRPVIEKAMDLFPDTEFTNAYGLTETSSTITVLGPLEHRMASASDDPAVRARIGSAGLPLPGIEIEIRDGDGSVLPTGERGEIYVRGQQVSGEYEGKGSMLDEDGWFPTRDGGYLDDDGYLFLEGRADDVIVRGGENLSPGEIEDVLLAHDSVVDAAVVGAPSEEWGEKVVAAVVVSESIGVEVLQDWVRDQMRSSRVPEEIEFLDELPYNETGKLLRRKVRERFVKTS